MTLPWLSWAGWALATAAFAHALFSRAERRALAWTSSALASLCLASLLLFVADQFLGVALTGVAHLLAFAAAAGLAFAGARLRHQEDAELPPAAGPPTPLELALFVVFAFVFAQSTGRRLFSPFDDWDAYTYHLELARQVGQGHFPTGFGRSFIGEYEAAFPPLPFHLYALVLALVPPAWAGVAIKLLLVALHALMCGYAWGLARHRLGLSRAASLAMLCVVGLRMPAAAEHAFLELTLTMLCTVFLLALLYHGWSTLVSPGAERKSSLPLLALLGFGVLWSTYAGQPLLVATMGAALLSRLVARESWRTWVDTVVVGAAAVALLVPLLVRNASALGNPLYPAMWAAVGGKDITQWFLDHRAAIGRPLSPPLSEKHLVLQIGAPISQLVLAAGIAIGLARPGALSRRVFWVAALGGYTWLWTVMFQFHEAPTWRYLFPMWPLAAVALAAGLDQAGARARAWAAVGFGVLVALYLARGAQLAPWQFWLPLFAAAGLVVYARRASSGPGGGALLAVVGALAWAAITFPHGLKSLASAQAVGALALLVGAIKLGPKLWEQRPAVRTAIAAAGVAALVLLAFNGAGLTGWWQHPVVAKDLPWLNANLTARDKVLLFDSRTWGLQVPFLPADSFAAEPFVRATNAEEATAALRSAGVTYVYDSRTYPWFDLDTRLEDLVAKGTLEVVYRRGDVWVGRLRD